MKRSNISVLQRLWLCGTHWEYDIEGRVIEKRFPDGVREQYEYYPVDALVKCKKIVGKDKTLLEEIEYFYTVDNRLEKKVYKHAERTETYTYDPVFPRIVKVFSSERDDRFTEDTESSISYKYGDLGGSDALKIVEVTNGDGSTTYEYSPDGDLLAKTFNNEEARWGAVHAFEETLGAGSEPNEVFSADVLGVFRVKEDPLTQQPLEVNYPGDELSQFCAYKDGPSRTLGSLWYATNEDLCKKLVSYQYDYLPSNDFVDSTKEIFYDKDGRKVNTYLNFEYDKQDRLERVWKNRDFVAEDYYYDYEAGLLRKKSDRMASRHGETFEAVLDVPKSPVRTNIAGYFVDHLFETEPLVDMFKVLGSEAKRVAWAERALKVKLDKLDEDKQEVIDIFKDRLGDFLGEEDPAPAQKVATAPLPDHRYNTVGDIEEVEHLNGETRSVYGWDGEHRLKYIEIHDAVTDRCLSLTEFDYDALGRLHMIFEHVLDNPLFYGEHEEKCANAVRCDIHNSCELYYYGSTNKLAAKAYFDDTIRYYSNYGYVDKSPDGEIGVYYTLRDGQGSTRLVYDVGAREVVARYDYTPHGFPSVEFASENGWDDPEDVEYFTKEDYYEYRDELYRAKTEEDKPAIIYRHPDHLYNGYYYHAPSGLYIMRHRAYSPELRQWLSRDPAGEFVSESLELYSYVDDNPANGYDPSGLWNIANPFTWGIPLKDGESPWNPLDSSAKWGATGRAFTSGSFIDGLVPFWDPFKESGSYDGCSEDGAFGNRMGELTRDWILGLAAGGVAGVGIKGAIAGGALASGASAAITGTEQGLRGSDLAKTIGRSAGIGAVAGGLGGVLGRRLGIVRKALNSGKIPDRNGLTIAGRSLQKHGDRTGSAFPRSKGDNLSRNAQGQKILQEILKSSKQTAKPNRFGGKDIFDISTGRGVRLDKNGNMIGFLEP